MPQDRRQPRRIAPGKTIFGHRSVRVQKRVTQMDWEVFGVQPTGEERSLCKVGWRYAFDPKPLMTSGSAPDFLAALEASLIQQPLTPAEVATMHAKAPGLPRQLPISIRDHSKWPVPGEEQQSEVDIRGFVQELLEIPAEKKPRRRLKKGKLSRKRKVTFDD